MEQITGLDSLVHSTRLMNADGINPFTMLCVGSCSPTLLERRLGNLEFEGSNPSPVILFSSRLCGVAVSTSGFEMAVGNPRNLQTGFSLSVSGILESAIKTPEDSGSIPDRAFKPSYFPRGCAW